MILQGFQPRLRSSFNTIVKVQKNVLVFALCELESEFQIVPLDLLYCSSLLNILFL